MTALSDDDLRAIRERVEKATPGPWVIVRYGDGDSLVIHKGSEARICFLATPGSHGDPARIAADASLIARARTDIPALLDTIAERDKTIEGLREALGEIVTWADSYPATVFRKPSEEAMADVAGVLNEHGSTPDGLYGSWARELMAGIGNVARTAIAKGREG